MVEATPVATQEDQEQDRELSEILADIQSLAEKYPIGTPEHAAYNDAAQVSYLTSQMFAIRAFLAEMGPEISADEWNQRKKQEDYEVRMYATSNLRAVETAYGEYDAYVRQQLGRVDGYAQTFDNGMRLYSELDRALFATSGIESYEDYVMGDSRSYLTMRGIFRGENVDQESLVQSPRPTGV